MSMNRKRLLIEIDDFDEIDNELEHIDKVKSQLYDNAKKPRIDASINTQSMFQSRLSNDNKIHTPIEGEEDNNDTELDYIMTAKRTVS